MIEAVLLDRLVAKNLTSSHAGKQANQLTAVVHCYFNKPAEFKKLELAIVAIAKVIIKRCLVEAK